MNAGFSAGNHKGCPYENHSFGVNTQLASRKNKTNIYQSNHGLGLAGATL